MVMELFLCVCLALSVILFFLSLILMVLGMIIDKVMKRQNSLDTASLILFGLAGICFGMCVFVPACMFLLVLIGG